jgi:hypothetical protein
MLAVLHSPSSRTAALFPAGEFEQRISRDSGRPASLQPPTGARRSRPDPRSTQEVQPLLLPALLLALLLLALLLPALLLLALLLPAPLLLALLLLALLLLAPLLPALLLPALLLPAPLLLAPMRLPIARRVTADA